MSILIPFRADSAHRTAIRAWQYGYLNVTYPNVRVIVASDNLPADKPFCRSAALNRARAKATTEWLWVLDTDAAPHPDDLAIALTTAQQHGWLTVYDGVLQLDQVGTRYTLDATSSPHDWNACTRRGPAHGLPLIHADIWDDVGGWDEQFTGWGYEDMAMHHTLTHTHPPALAPPIEWIRTLWHPRDYPARPAMLNAKRYHDLYLKGTP